MYDNCGSVFFERENSKVLGRFSQRIWIKNFRLRQGARLEAARLKKLGKPALLFVDSDSETDSDVPDLTSHLDSDSVSSLNSDWDYLNYGYSNFVNGYTNFVDLILY